MAPKDPSFFSSQVTQARRVYLEGSPDPTTRLAVLSIGCEQCLPDYHIVRPTFPYFSIEFVANGAGWLTIGKQRHRLIPGAVFAYGPQIAHEIQNDPNDPMTKFFVDFSGTDVPKLIIPPAISPGQVQQTSEPAKILKIFENLLNTASEEGPYRKQICAAILEQLIYTIADTTVRLGTMETQAFETFQRCKQYIEKHYLECRDLTYIAAKCDIDGAYLCRLFQRYDHSSPWQFVVELKMRDASERLQKPGTLVRKVAQEMGFSDPFQFSRTFRRVIGVSPKKYIQMHTRQSP